MSLFLAIPAFAENPASPLRGPTSNSPVVAQPTSVTAAGYIKQIDEKLSISLLQYKTKQPRELSLSDAINLAIDNNPSLRSVADDIVSRDYDLKAAQQTWNPNLAITSQSLPRVNSSSTYTFDSLLDTGTSSSRRNLESSATLLGSWNFLSPTRVPSINSASSALDADILLFFTSARDLAFNVQSAYYKLQGLRALIGDYTTIIDSSQRTYQAIYSKYLAGYANLLQVEQVKSQLALDTTQLIEYHTSYLETASELARVLGLPDFTIVTPSDPLLPVQPWPYTLDTTLTLGLDNNEKISRSLAQADSAKWKGYLENNRVLPSLTLNIYGQPAYANDQFSRSGILVQSPVSQSVDYGAYLSLDWRIFQGGTNYSLANSQFAQQSKFISESRSQRDSVVSAIRSAFAGMTGNSLSIDTSKQAYLSARTALEASQMRYSAGLDDVTTIVQATQLLSRASLQQSNVIVQYNTNISNLYRSAAVWPDSSQASVYQLLRGYTRSSLPPTVRNSSQ